jgi:hypothetical protein
MEMDEELDWLLEEAKGQLESGKIVLGMGEY